MKLILLSLIILGISCGFIEPIIQPYWDNPNALFATELVVTFKLESGLPQNALFQILLPNSVSSSTSTVSWRKYNSLKGSFTVNEIVATSTGKITIKFSETLTNSQVYQLKLVAVTQFPSVNSMMGLKTMASVDSNSLVYDSNPVFANLYLYSAYNSLAPTLARVIGYQNDRILQPFTANVTLLNFQEPTANSPIPTQKTKTRLRFEWHKGTQSGYKFTGDCVNLIYGKVATNDLEKTQVLEINQYTCVLSADKSFIDVTFEDVTGVAQPVETVRFQFGAMNPGYKQSDSIRVFLFHDTDVFTEYGDTQDIMIATQQLSGTLSAYIGQNMPYGTNENLFRFYQTPDSCNGKTSMCKLVNSATFVITPNTYNIPGPCELELQLYATGLTIYGATIKIDLLSINNKAATCLATTDSIRCTNLKQISISDVINIEVKFSIQESVGSEVTNVNANAKFYVLNPLTNSLEVVSEISNAFATSKPYKPSGAAFAHFPAQQLYDYKTLVGAITPGASLTIAPYAPDNSTGNTLEIAFDFSTQGYTSTNGMRIQIFLPSEFKLNSTTSVLGTDSDMVNSIKNRTGIVGNYHSWNIDFSHADTSGALIGQKKYIQITNVQLPTKFQPLNSKGSFDIFMRFLDKPTVSTTSLSSEWLFNVFMKANPATTDFTNLVFGPSFWREDGTGNNAEEIPSMLRLVGYMTYADPIIKPTKFGVILKRGLPFMSGDENECHCGANFDTGIKCYYFGSSEGLIADLAVMGYETYNHIVIDISGLVTTTTISSTSPISIAIPLKTTVGTSLTNTFSTPQQYTVIGMGDLALKEVLQLEFPTARGFASSYSVATPGNEYYFVFSNSYTQSGAKVPMVAGQTNQMRMILSDTIQTSALAADINFQSVEAGEIVCSSTGLFTSRTTATRLRKPTKDTCFSLTYPIANGDTNYCIFCGSSGFGFPFNTRNNLRDLYDVLEFQNVELLAITSGAMAQTGYYSGFSKGTSGSGGIYVKWSPGINANEPLWAGGQISSITALTEVVPKSAVDDFRGITLSFKIGVATNVTGAYIILTETTPGRTTTGFLITGPTLCSIIIDGKTHACSMTQTLNNFIIDVTTLRLLPQDITVNLHGLILSNTAALGAYFDARTCTGTGCTAVQLVDDYSTKPAFVQYKTGIEWVLGVDNLEWQPGMCLGMDVYVFGWIWEQDLSVKIRFKKGGSSLELAGLRCNIFQEQESHSSTKFKTCEVTDFEITIQTNEALASGFKARVLLCNPNVVPFALAADETIQVQGKLFSLPYLLDKTEYETFPRFNVITDVNPYVEGVSDPESVFQMQALEVKEGGEWQGMRNELQFKITTAFYDFNENVELFIWCDSVYADHLGLPLKMATYIGSLAFQREIPYQHSRSQNEITIVGPTLRLMKNLPFILTIKNLLPVVPSTQEPLPTFTVGLKTFSGKLLERTTAQLVQAKSGLASMQAVAISSITPGSNLFGALTDYTIAFQIISAFPNSFKVIILDLSQEYYPYSLESFRATLTLKKGEEEIEIDWEVYGNSAFKISTREPKEWLTTEINYILTIDKLQNPYVFIKERLNLLFDMKIYTVEMQVYHTSHSSESFDTGFNFVSASTDSYFQIEDLNSAVQTSVTLPRGGFSFRGCITNLARKGIDSNIKFKFIKQARVFTIKDIESGKIVSTLLILKGRYQVCFEIGTQGTTPENEYFLGFEIIEGSKKYIVPQQIPMFVTKTQIVIPIASSTQCIAGGNSVPIRFRLPFNPYDELKVGITLVANPEQNEGLKLFAKSEIVFSSEDNNLESFLQIYCDQNFTQLRKVNIYIRGYDQNSFTFSGEKTEVDIITTTPDSDNFTLNILPMQQQTDPLQPKFTLKSSQKGVVYWLLNHDGPWAPEVSFEQVKEITNGNQNLLNSLFVGNNVSLNVREQKNHGMRTILVENGFVVAKFSVLAQRRYFLKAWMQNPSGSVISHTLNFTSYSPPSTVLTSEPHILEILHVTFTLQFNLDKSVAQVKSKLFVKEIEGPILTLMMCIGEKGSGIKDSSIQDNQGRSCKVRSATIKRELQTAPVTVSSNQTTFEQEFLFLVQNDVGIHNDMTVTNFRNYMNDQTVYKDAVNNSIYFMQGSPKILSITSKIVGQSTPVIFTTPNIQSTNYTITVLVMMNENSYVLAGIKQMKAGFDHPDEIYKRDRRTSQEVWRTLQSSEQLQKKFVFGFNTPNKKYSEKVASFKFTELLPETNFQLYLIQSSQQPESQKAIWSDFQIHDVRTNNYHQADGMLGMFNLMSVLMMMVVYKLF